MSHESNNPLPPDLHKQAIHLLTSKKPVGASAASNYPYYSKIYGEEIKAAVDKMRQDKNDILYRYSVWCTDFTGLSESTLYNRINQSIRYLLERMDKDGIYTDWREHVQLKKEPGIGVRIFYKPGFGNNAHVGITPEHVTPADSKPIWYRKMLDWIEDEGETEPFVKENLVLTSQEQLDIKVLLQPLGYMYSIDESSVKIIKV